MKIRDAFLGNELSASSSIAKPISALPTTLKRKRSTSSVPSHHTPSPQQHAHFHTDQIALLPGLPIPSSKTSPPITPAPSLLISIIPSRQIRVCVEVGTGRIWIREEGSTSNIDTSLSRCLAVEEWVNEGVWKGSGSSSFGIVVSRAVGMKMGVEGRCVEGVKWVAGEMMLDRVDGMAAEVGLVCLRGLDVGVGGMFSFCFDCIPFLFFLLCSPFVFECTFWF